MKKELILSFAYKAGGMGMSFIAISLLLKNLGASDYGTWAALVSLLAWIQLSDFGVGYVLKNRIAKHKKPSEMIYLVSGVFQFYFIVSLFVMLLFYFFGDMLEIVRTHYEMSLVLFLGVMLFFPLTVGSAILQGLQKNSLSNLMIFLQGALWLTIIYCFSENLSLTTLSILYVFSVLASALFGYILGIKLLTGELYQGLSEILNITHLKLALPLWGIGIRFIILQLTSVVLFSLGTYLTYANLSPEAAAKYDVLFKFYQVFLTLFNIVLSVYWPSIAQNFSEGKGSVLQRKFFELHGIAMFFSILSLLFALFFSEIVIGRYSSGNIHVLVQESLAFSALISIQMFAYSGAVFLNVVEKLKGQIYLAVFAAALVIPLVLYFYKIHVGIVSVPLAISILIIPSLIYCNWSAYFHVVKKAA